MKSKLKYWWLILLRGIVFLFLSFYVIAYPVDSLVGLAVYIGVSLLFTGIFLILLALSSRDTMENWGWRLAEGFIDVIFAFVLLSNPGITATVIPFVVGFWMMVYGIMMFVDSFQVKKSGEENWWIGLLGGLLCVLFGYMITNNLLVGAVAITYWIGFGFIIAGIMNISVSLRMRKLKTRLE